MSRSSRATARKVAKTMRRSRGSPRGGERKPCAAAADFPARTRRKAGDAGRGARWVAGTGQGDQAGQRHIEAGESWSRAVRAVNREGRGERGLGKSGRRRV